jgi:hypothetical protein
MECFLLWPREISVCWLSRRMSFGNKRTFISIKIPFINVYENHNLPNIIIIRFSVFIYLFNVESDSIMDERILLNQEFPVFKFFSHLREKNSAFLLKRYSLKFSFTVNCEISYSDEATQIFLNGKNVSTIFVG